MQREGREGGGGDVASSARLGSRDERMQCLRAAMKACAPPSFHSLTNITSGDIFPYTDIGPRKRRTDLVFEATRRRWQLLVLPAWGVEMETCDEGSVLELRLRVE